MRRKLQRAAIVLGLAIVGWWLLPQVAPFLGAGLDLGVAVLKVLLIVLALCALWLVSAMLWDSSKYLYRRLVVPRRRARRISRIRNERNWREAASRGHSSR